MVGSFRERAYSAVRWTTVSAVIIAAAQLLQTIILARLLQPSDFGLMALAAAVTGIMLILCDGGLNKALIHFSDQPERVLHSLYWANLLLATGIALAGLLLSSLFKGAFPSEYIPILQCVLLALPIAAFGQQARALAEKNLRFRDLATNEVAASILGLLIACTAAVLGAGVFALVAGMLTTITANAVLARTRLSMHPARDFRLEPSDIRPFARFGVFLVGDTLVTTLNRQLDILFGGMFSTSSSLGYYSVPRDLSLKVSLVINPISSRVGFPLMSLVKHDRSRLANIYLTGISLTSSVNFPLYSVIGIFSNELVSLLYGAAWAPAAGYLRILAAWGLLRSISNPIGSLLYAAGIPRTALIWNIAMLAIFPPVLWFAATRGGLQGIAWAMLALQALIFVPGWLLLIRPTTGLPLYRYCVALLRPLLASIGAGGVAILSRQWVGDSISQLPLNAANFFIVYAAISWIVNKHAFVTVYGLLRFSWNRTDTDQHL